MNLGMQSVLRTYSKVKLLKKFPEGVRLLYTAGEREINAADIAPVTEAVIKEALKASFVPFTDGYTCFHVRNCTFDFCKNKTQRDDPDIFVNKRTGFFVCENCKVTGNWSTFSGWLTKSKNGEPDANDEIIKKDCSRIDKYFSNWERVVESSLALNELNEEAYKSVFKQFKLMICSRDTAQKLNIRINEKRTLLYFPLYCMGSVVGYKTCDRQGNTLTHPRIDSPGFLMYPGKTESVVIVPHLPDFFALVSQNLPYRVLCLPYGVTNLPQSALPFLEGYNKIILWLGKKALDATGNFARKLNNRRCHVVRPTDNQDSAVTAVAKREDVLLILEDARPTWHEAITTFHSLRQEVLAELQNKDLVAGVPWKKFTGLTKILKGHRRGELTVLTGPTGVGKTTFMSEYSLDLAMQGVNTLWGSFEIKNCRLAKMMLQQFAGVPLAENLRRFDALSDKFEQLPIYFLTFHGQQPLAAVMDAVEHGSYTYDIAHVIIDNVQFMIEVATDSYQMDRFWKQDCLIQAFRSFASKNNCHVTLVMHPKKGMDGMDLSVNSIFGGAKAVQEADNVFIIQSKGSGPLGGKKYLQISKNRFSGDLGVIPLNFDKSSLSFSETRAQGPREEPKEHLRELESNVVRELPQLEEIDTNFIFRNCGS